MTLEVIDAIITENPEDKIVFVVKDNDNENKLYKIVKIGNIGEYDILSIEDYMVLHTTLLKARRLKAKFMIWDVVFKCSGDMWVYI